MNPGRIVVGIEPTPNRSPTFDEMRAAIKRAERDSALIHAAMAQADVQGLNGEDRYTLLAYHALISLELYYQRTIELLSKMPVISPVYDGKTPL
jgi:hypothetical protein